MNLPILQSEVKTMSSKDLLELINQIRQNFGESPVRLNDFNNRIIDELDGYEYETKESKNNNNTCSKVHLLNKEQCLLVALRETSQAVRANLPTQINKYFGELDEGGDIDPSLYMSFSAISEGLAVLEDIIWKLEMDLELSYSEQCVLFVVTLANKGMPPLTRSLIRPIIGNDKVWTKIQQELVAIHNNQKRELNSNFLFDPAIMEEISKTVKQSKQTKKIITKTYLVRKDGTNFIKIGKSINVKNRIQTLQTQNGTYLEILHIFNEDIESLLHSRFSHLRTLGEWFEDKTGEIMDFINQEKDKDI